MLRCDSCHLQVPVTDDGLLPQHAYPLHAVQQAEDAMEGLLAVVDLDRWSSGPSEAVHVERNSRAATHEGRLADALPALTALLVRRDAAAAAETAVARLTHFTAEGAPYPLFTEGSLYDLLGKDDARTILARLRDVQHAIGYSDPGAGEDTDSSTEDSTES